jgi:hypothetical protein
MHSYRPIVQKYCTLHQITLLSEQRLAETYYRKYAVMLVVYKSRGYKQGPPSLSAHTPRLSVTRSLCKSFIDFEVLWPCGAEAKRRTPCFMKHAKSAWVPVPFYPRVMIGFLVSVKLNCSWNYKGTVILSAGFEVLTGVVMKNSVFWYITPYSPLKGNRSVTSIFRVEEHAKQNLAKYFSENSVDFQLTALRFLKMIELFVILIHSSIAPLPFGWALVSFPVS